MCLLIGTNQGSKISNNSISTGWNKNSDGGGYAFLDNKKIVVKKFLNVKEFKNSYNEDFKKYGDNSKFLIHFRYATHGINNLSNVHPFKINDNLVFGHNGIINSVRDDKKLSDTRVFNVDILKKLSEGFLQNPAMIELISDFIGHSKLVFLSTDNEFTIVNESLGHWNKKNTIWYSNDSYKKCNIVYSNFRDVNGKSYGRGWNFNNVYGTAKTETPKAKNNIIKYADNEFLKCDFCDSETDITLKTETGYDVCESCNATTNPYQI